MLRIISGGSFNNTNRFVDAILGDRINSPLDSLAQIGVDALRETTPRESGATSDAWSYEINQNGSNTTIWWNNTNIVDGFNVAIGLQYGHGTGTGGWVQGYDYINPALRPIFDAIADAVWREVQNA